MSKFDLSVTNINNYVNIESGVLDTFLNAGGQNNITETKQSIILSNNYESAPICIASISDKYIEDDRYNQHLYYIRTSDAKYEQSVGWYFNIIIGKHEVITGSEDIYIYWIAVGV